MTCVVTGCRLHFGLFSAGEGPAGRRFGGCGLMVEAPAVAVRAELSPVGWSGDGPLGERALRFARLALRDDREHWPWWHWPWKGWRVTADGPPEHVGLGVGTALGLAVARAVCLADLTSRPSDDEQAARVGRGKRSGVGLHGFRHGGFIVDAGKPDADALPELGGRSDFPTAWRVVLIRPRVARRWSGDREQAAFDRPRAVPSLRLADLARGVLLPAVRAGNFGTFAPALGEYNRLAGEPFVSDQGGVYAGPEVAAVVEALRGWGWAGVGQSSWGPTVFAVCPDMAAAADLADRCRARLAGLDDVTVTAARNTGSMTVFTK